MKYLVKGSLRSYLSIPQVRPIDISAVSLPVTVTKIKEFYESIEVSSSANPTPEEEAIEFYTLNHLVSLIRARFDMDEVLPDWAQTIAKEYVTCLAQQGKRMYAYLLTIISRESRHLKDPATTMKKMHAAHKAWHASVKGKSDSHGTAMKFFNNTPDMSLGDYVKNCVDLFNFGSFHSGYGGPAWGTVANCLYQMVSGKTSMELMLDSAFCLAHNNGPIFNKGMFYQHYNGLNLMKILDVQRSGQVPELVINGEINPDYLDKGLKNLILETKHELPGTIGDYVDWYEVEAKGALGKYGNEKAKQPKKKVIVPGGKVFVATGEFFVMPVQSVVQGKREAA